MGLVILDLHAEVFVTTFVTGSQTLVYSLGIHEELKGGTRLTLCRNLVVIPSVIVDVADPCHYMAGLRFDGYEGTMHEPYHITYGVHAGHLCRDMSFLIVEQRDRMFLVHIVVHAVGLVGVLRLQGLVYGEAMRDTFYEVRNNLSVLITPRVLMVPVVLKGTLDNTHLLRYGLLGIFLKTGVDGCIYTQSTAVEVIAFELRLLLEELRHGITEILSASLIVIHWLHVELYRLLD